MRFVAPALALFVFTAQAIAAEPAVPPAPLAPGKAAGVKEAQLRSAGTVLILLGITGLAVALATTSGKGHNGSSTTTTTSGTP